MSEADSGIQSSRSRRRSRLAATIIILALFAFSVIIVYEANYLNWPFSSQGRGSHSSSAESSSSVSPPRSSLEISVSIIDNGIQSCGCGAGIQIYTGTDITGPVASSGNTDFPDGVVFFTLAPAQYTVKILTSLVDFQPITVSTYNDTTTELYASINQTSYNDTFFDIYNPDGTAMLPPWGTIFLQVNSNSIVSSDANSIYLILPPTPSESTTATTTTGSVSGAQTTTSSNTNPPQIPGSFPFTILSQVLSPKDGSLRIQVKLDSDVNVSAVKGISILTFNTSYDVHYVPPLPNSTSSLTVSTASPQNPTNCSGSTCGINCSSPEITCTTVTNTTL